MATESSDSPRIAPRRRGTITIAASSTTAPMQKKGFWGTRRDIVRQKQQQQTLSQPTEKLPIETETTSYTYTYTEASSSHSSTKNEELPKPPSPKPLLNAKELYQSAGIELKREPAFKCGDRVRHIDNKEKVGFICIVFHSLWYKQNAWPKGIFEYAVEYDDGLCSSCVEEKKLKKIHLKKDEETYAQKEEKRRKNGKLTIADFERNKQTI